LLLPAAIGVAMFITSSLIYDQTNDSFICFKDGEKVGELKIINQFCLLKDQLNLKKKKEQK